MVQKKREKLTPSCGCDRLLEIPRCVDSLESWYRSRKLPHAKMRAHHLDECERTTRLQRLFCLRRKGEAKGENDHG